MSAEDNDDLSAIAWPGFVDILSAVIIMFVFFLMIVATALFFHIIIYISKVKSGVVAEEVESEQEYEFTQVQTQFAESTEQEVDIKMEENTIIVHFGTDSISVLEASKDEISSSLLELIANIKSENYNILIEAVRPESTIENVGRQVALARMLNIRNTVIDSGVNSSEIFPKISETYEIDGQTQWVKIQVQEKP